MSLGAMARLYPKQFYLENYFAMPPTLLSCFLGATCSIILSLSNLKLIALSLKV